MPSSRSSQPGAVRPGSTPSLNRQILALAVPAFGALIAEPLLVLADSAIVGHLGSAQLAGLTLGSTLVQTLVGLMIFLAYSTTPTVARAFGAGRLQDAYSSARNGLWVALALGTLIAGGLALAVRDVLAAMGGQGQVLTYGLDYLLPSLLGLPAMLLVLAATGALRGFQDTKTPLYVAMVGAGINVLLSWALVYPAGLGVAGSALATSLVQWAMALTLSVKILKDLPTHSVSFTPDLPGLLTVFRVGAWLMVRAITMRCALLATVFVATAQGTENLAAYQLTLSFFNLLAFALDALAIAAQALLGKEMGAQNLRTEEGRAAVRNLKNRLVRWSLGFGLFTAVLTPALGYSLAWVFTSDPEVQHLFALSLLVLGVGQPLAAYVFIMDGVLIGAADVRYLGLASAINLLVYLPALLGIYLWLSGVAAPHNLGTAAYLLLWVAYALWYMGARGLTLWWRARTEVWMDWQPPGSPPSAPGQSLEQVT